MINVFRLKLLRKLYRHIRENSIDLIKLFSVYIIFSMEYFYLDRFILDSTLCIYASV